MMRLKSFFPAMMMLGFSLFCSNVSAEEIKSLTLSSEPWTFRGNMGGVSVSKEISTDSDGNYYAVYYNNSSQTPTYTVIQDGKASLVSYVNSKSTDVQTMTFKGALDIAPIDTYTIEYHEPVIEEDTTTATYTQELVINCPDGAAFYNLYDDNGFVTSGVARFTDGKAEASCYIFNPDDVNLSTLSLKVYGIMEDSNDDVSNFSVSEESHNLDGTTYRSTYIVSTPEPCMGLVTVEVLHNNEVVSANRIWIDDTTEAEGSVNIYDVEDEENYEYRVCNFMPADYRIVGGDIEMDGSYVYPRLTFEEIFKTISTGNVISDITILDNGNSMKVDTNSSDASTWDDAFEKDEKQMGYLKHINGCLGLPDSLYEKMHMTPSGSGMFEETYEDLKVTWTYTAGRGFEVLYEKIG